MGLNKYSMDDTTKKDDASVLYCENCGHIRYIHVEGVGKCLEPDCNCQKYVEK